MAKLKLLNKIRNRFLAQVDFVCIYVAENHPAEKKHYVSGNVRKIYAHKNLEDRIKAAEYLLEIVEDWTILIDDMNDQAGIDYAAQPDRIYVIQNGIIAFVIKLSH